MLIFRQRGRDTDTGFEGWAMPNMDRYVHSMKGRALDFEAMSDAAQRFLGTHDYAAFSANRGNGEEEQTVRKIWRSEWKKRGGRFIILQKE